MSMGYRVGDRDERRERAARLRRWAMAGTPLTHVSWDETAARLDGVALLTDAMQG
ncbi:MAG: hypothetical protein ACRD1K_17380 [Acidimicrobiales bacterium]